MEATITAPEDIRFQYSKRKHIVHVKKYVDRKSIDKQTEYETLRQEILNAIAACGNYKIAMYTITVAILCAAFEFESGILFLIPYVILFAFQWAIESKNENMIVLSAYISVFLEKGDGWETNSGNIKKTIYAKSTYKKPKGFASRVIGRVSSAQLGLLCSISCIVYSAMELVTQESLAVYIKGSCCCVLSIVLYILIRIQTHKVFKLHARKEEFITSLKELKEARESRIGCCMAYRNGSNVIPAKCPCKNHSKVGTR